MTRPVGMRYAAKSNGSPPPGAPTGGTMGGRPKAMGRRPGSRPMAIGDEIYLWVLVIIEVLLMGALRKWSRRHHGG